MASDTQTTYDATYQAARDAIQRADVGEAIERAAREVLSSRTADLNASIADRCADAFRSFLDNNREEIIERAAEIAAERGNDEEKL